jgi:integrase
LKISNPKQNLVHLAKAAESFLKSSKSKATIEAYRSDWAGFVQWCDEHHLDPIPATAPTVALYITGLAEQGRAPSTISRALTSISQAHKAARCDTPTRALEVVEVFKGIKRKLGTAQKRASPLVLPDLKKVIDALRPNFLGRRDAALLLLGWAGALRRSEIVTIDGPHLEFVEEGMILTIVRSKTDQEGAGYRLGIPFAQDERYCPVKRLQHWIDLAGISKGPLFFSVGTPGKKFTAHVESPKRLSARYINTIIKKRVALAGLKPDGYSGHSLRAGFVTTAAKFKIPEHLIQLHTRHRSSKVLRQYIRDGSLFGDNPMSTML